MGTQAPLGKLVNTLVGTAPPSLDHIKNSAFVGSQSDNFTSNGSAELGALASTLLLHVEKRKEVRSAAESTVKFRVAITNIYLHPLNGKAWAFAPALWWHVRP